MVPVTVKGGWDKCKGPFTDYEAHAWGIDEWDCDGKCYVRRDKNGGNKDKTKSKITIQEYFSNKYVTLTSVIFGSCTLCV